MPVLIYCTGSHIQYLIVSLVKLVEKKTDTLMDVIGFDLAHHVRTGYCSIYIRDYYLLVFIPQEYQELGLLLHSSRNLKHHFGFVLPVFQFHSAYHLGIRRFLVFNDLLVLELDWGLDNRR